MPVRPLSKELKKKAEAELNETPQILEDSLVHLKDWVAKSPHLRARTDDQWLAAFLRGCKFSLERAKEKLDLYYSLRSIAPDFFSFKHTDDKFMEILSLGAVLILPKLAGPDSPRINLIRPGAYDAEKYRISEVIGISMVLEKICFMEDDNAVVSGFESILDLDNVTMAHFLQMTPTQMKKMVVSSQDAAPVRMKGVHYLNTPPGFETLFNAMRALLHEKNRKRLYVHNKNYEAMYKHISKDVLPAEYGGNGGTFQEIIDYWKKKVLQYREFLDEDLQFGTDESKRPGRPNTAETLFGIEGSFRQLQVD